MCRVSPITHSFSSSAILISSVAALSLSLTHFAPVLPVVLTFAKVAAQYTALLAEQLHALFVLSALRLTLLLLLYASAPNCLSLAHSSIAVSAQVEAALGAVGSGVFLGRLAVLALHLWGQRRGGRGVG
jgi:hypothetical protein